MSEPLSTDKIFGEGLDDLAQLRKQTKNPILVKFVAPHCPSCETLAPVLQQLVAEHLGSLHLVTIDITDEPEFAMELDVRSAPTVVIFQQEMLVERIVGLKPRKLYTEAIQRVLAV